MHALFSGLAEFVASAYNTSVGTPGVLTSGVNVFVGDLPDKPSVAVGLLPDASWRNPRAIVRTPEFVLVVRNEANKTGSGMQMMEKVYRSLDRTANPVDGYPCVVRALEEQATLGFDTQKRPLFVTRFVLWGINLT